MIKEIMQFKKIISGVVFGMLIVLVSCNKKQDCFECTTTITVKTKYLSQTESWSISDTRDFCDLTEEKIREYEKNNTDTISEVVGDTVITKITLTRCTK